MCCVFLDIYSPVQRNNNEKKKEMDVLQPGGKANASLGDGIRY